MVGHGDEGLLLPEIGQDMALVPEVGNVQRLASPLDIRPVDSLSE